VGELCNPEDIGVEEMNMQLARFFLLLMFHHLSRFLTCHNDIINAGQNNRLFALGTDMDRGRLRLSHMQKGTYYAQICDKESLLTASRMLFHAFP
jgi:hypothetical protein